METEGKSVNHQGIEMRLRFWHFTVMPVPDQNDKRDDPEYIPDPPKTRFRVLVILPIEHTGHCQ